MAIPKNAQHREQFLKIPVLAFFIGAVSIIGSLIIGYYAHKLSFEKTEKIYHAFYHKEAVLLARMTELLSDKSNDEIVETLQRLLHSEQNKPVDKYMCILDKDSHLVSHTAEPATVGKFCGDNTLLSSDKPGITTLGRLVRSRRDYVGGYISSAGEVQVAAFASIPTKNWSLGIHRSKAALENEMKENLSFITIGFLAVCLFLMPLSLILFHIAFLRSKQQHLKTFASLAESEERFREIAEKIQEVFWVVSPDWRQVHYVSPAFEKIWGRSCQSLYDNPFSWARALSHEDRKDVDAFIEMQKKISVPEIIFPEYSIRLENGENRWISARGYPVMDKTGNVKRVVGIAEDITAQKNAAEALAESESRYRELFDRIGSGVAVYSAEQNAGDFIIKDFNRAAVSIDNISKSNVIGKTVTQVFPGIDRFGLLDVFRRVWKTGEAENYPVSFYEDGRISGWRNNYVYKLPSGEIVAVYSDETDRMSALEALRESERKYRMLIENLPQKIFYKNNKSVYIACNANFADYFNLTPDQIQGKTDDDIVPGKFAEKFRADDERIKRSKKTEAFDETYIIDGREVIIHMVKTPVLNDEGDVIGILGIFWDITRRKRMEESMVKAQKMEALGTLAGGIAHDFNNILAAIIGYTEMTAEALSGETLLYNNLQQVLNAGKRAKALVRRILAFSRREERAFTPLRIKSLLNEVLKLLRASLPATIEINQEIQLDVTILGDSVGLHQVVMNICTNAMQAMEKTGGLLTVSLDEVPWDSDLSAKLPDLTPGRYVCISISDTGHGMEPMVQARIFEPFFTTKEKGEGTGLGLSVVHGIVKDHDGAVAVYSQPDEGTVFKLFFPMVEAPIQDQSDPEEFIPSGTESILFIDDEVAITALAQKILISLGYSVVTENHPVNALALFKEDPDAFDLVITDMTMPVMTGESLARQLMKIKPGLPVILCTGFSRDLDEKEAEKMGIRAYISKPVFRKHFADTIRRVLDVPRPSSRDR